MQKQKIEWGRVSIGVPSIWYSLEGTEKDKELVEAFFNNDKDKIIELINQGANKDVIVSIKRDNEVKTGDLMYHLLTEQPQKPIIQYKRPVVKKVGDNGARVREERKERERAEVRSRINNQKRADQIIDMFEFWIDVVGSFGEFYSDEIKFEKVDKYLERAVQIPFLLAEYMEGKGFDYNEETDKLYARKITQYRRSSLSIEEIKQAIQNDVELSGKLHFTDLFKKKGEADAQKEQLSRQEPDEEFAKRVEEKHRAFFEGDSKDDSDKGSSGGGPGGISRATVLEEVQKDGMFLEKVSDRYGDDIEVVSLAVGNNANAFAFASKSLRENKEVAQLFVDIKKADFEEAKMKGASDALINSLQNQIQVILDLHERALEEKEQSHFYEMSM